MKQPVEKKIEVIRKLLRDEINSDIAASVLRCDKRTIRNYKKTFLEKGIEGLTDHRHGNNYKLTVQQRLQIRKVKEDDRWRSARNIRDRLDLKVHKRTVEKLVKAAGLSRENRQQVKALQTFEATHPNDLWQTDIMGKILFPHLGILYLIGSLDDHSRFVPGARWFFRQNKINVFTVWYESLSKWGLPKAMLQDEGSQYKARTHFGEADYEGYAKALGIELIWAHTAQTKGKIERFWRFVQDDFVREVLYAKTLDEVNGAFTVWLAKYNYVFKSEYFGRVTRASRYHISERRLSQFELQHLLTIQERRRVTRQNTISLYGCTYRIPPGYMKCRIWVKIVGNKVLFESMGTIFWKTRLKMK